MKNIYLFPHTELGFIRDFLYFQDIEYQDFDTYDQNLDPYGRHIIPERLVNSSNNILILPTMIFYAMMEWPVSRSKVIEYCRNQNQLWISKELDAFFDIFHKSKDYKDIWIEIDKVIPQGSITLIVAFKPSVDSWINQLKNIVIESFPTVATMFNIPYRMIGAISQKQSTSKDFMLLMLKKKFNRPHRDILWEELHRRSHLLKNATVKYTDTDDNGNPNFDEYIGKKIKIHHWLYPYPSMDLYNNHYLELIPETLCKDAYFVTEKTIKAFFTGTPFIAIAAPGYLEYLRSLGFQTFGSLIDESYDTELDLNLRVKKCVDTLDQIINSKGGAKKFYNDSKEILDHNKERFFRLCGSYGYDMDLFLHKILHKISG